MPRRYKPQNMGHFMVGYRPNFRPETLEDPIAKAFDELGLSLAARGLRNTATVNIARNALNRLLVDMLRSHDWRLARGRQGSSAVRRDNQAHHLFAHSLPRDCLRVTRIWSLRPISEVHDYARAGGTLFSSRPELMIEYVSGTYAFAEETWSPSFRRLVVAVLAAHLAPRFRVDAVHHRRLLERALQARFEAQREDLLYEIEKSPEPTEGLSDVAPARRCG